MRNNKDIMINLKTSGISLFTIYILTASLYVAIFESLTIQIIILTGILGILLINDIVRKRKYIFNISDVFFIFAIFAALASLHSSQFIVGEIAGPIIFSLGIIISFFIRRDVNDYKYSIQLLKWGGVLIAISVIFSYFFPQIYSRMFLSLLQPVFSKHIMELMENGYQVGFTSQVAYTAGYIVFAIGVILCSWIILEKEKRKKGAFLLLILIIGLLFTQKRAHLFFMLVTLFFVYIQYSRYSKEKLIKTVKIILFTIFTLIFAIIMAMFTDIGQTLFSRIILTFQELIAGKDITSNRIPLYLHAWELFLQHPLFGIGWGNFSKTVVGTVTVQTEMQVHNVYLQLLSETGLIGTTFILLPFLLTYIYTIKMTYFLSNNKGNYSFSWKFAVLYSLYIQTFLLLYGFTGNPLYDNSFLMMYFFAFGLIYSFRKYNHENLISNDN